MRTGTSACAVLAATVLAFSVSTALAEDFNPQPEPPGKTAPTTHTITQHTLPPGPCTPMNTQTGGHGTMMAMRKAGGGPSSSTMPNSSVHCLNPQPLPPG